MSKWIVLVAFVSSAGNLLANRPAPRPIVWQTPKGDYHFSVTRKGEVAVVDAKDHKKVLWKTTLTKYVQSVDQLFLVDDGKRVVCIRNNHRVKTIDDMAVESITKDGVRATYKASAFIDKLQPGATPGKIKSPFTSKQKWMNRIKTVDAKGITIVNAKGEEKTVTWKTE